MACHIGNTDQCIRPTLIGPTGQYIWDNCDVSAPWRRGMNLRLMDHAGAVNVPGAPGSFLYLLPLGAGQAKRDNFHHWGYPLHSFWCCYGEETGQLLR